MERETGEEVAWNLSQYLIGQIAECLGLASSYYIRMNFLQSFLALKEARKKINASLNEEEEKEFESKEKILIQHFAILTSDYDFSNGKEEKKKWKTKGQIRGIVAFEIDSYSNLLMNKIAKYGYGVPAKEDKTRLTA
jgi:hypothetical protein